MSLNIQEKQEIKVQKSGLISKVLKSISARSDIEAEAQENINDNEELLESIYDVKKEWVCANLNFDYACEEQAIDYYTYKIKSCEVKYEYLIKKAKERGIRVEPINRPFI